MIYKSRSNAKNRHSASGSDFSSRYGGRFASSSAALIDIARGLKALLPKAKFNDVTAQYALVSRQALISGKMQKIVREVDSVINSYGQDLVGKMLEIFQNTQRYMIITGGGVILLQDTIIDLLNASGLEPERDYFVVNHSLASVLNSSGALFSVLFMAANGKK